MLRLASLLLLLLSFAGADAQTAPASDPLAAFNFLLGTWSAASVGGSARAAVEGRYTFRRDLNGHALERTSSADTCKGPQSFDCDHHDRLTIFADTNAQAAHGSSVLGFYMDSEGHIIYYTAALPEPHTLVLTSQSPATAPHFRLTYHLADDGTMTGSFAMAPPGSSDYKPYMEWTGRKVPSEHKG